MEGYTYHEQRGLNVARARGVELHISPKKTYEVMNAIRGLPVDKARSMLEDVVALKKAIHSVATTRRPPTRKASVPAATRRRSRSRCSRSSTNAEANAEFEGLDADRLVIHVAACARGKIQKASMPRAHGGRPPGTSRRRTSRSYSPRRRRRPRHVQRAEGHPGGHPPGPAQGLPGPGERPRRVRRPRHPADPDGHARHPHLRAARDPASAGGAS